MKEYTQEPIVSVIMPVYNGEAYIEIAIRSVMAQTYKNWRLLVVDDGSTDSTIAIVQQLMQDDSRIQLLRNPVNMGVAKTRNRGLDLCDGDYVAFLDADDIWHSEKLTTQIEKMKLENADLAYTSYAVVNCDGNQIKKPYLVPGSVTFDELLKENVIGCSTVVLSSSVAKKRRFEVDFYHEDYCLWLDLLQQGHRAVGCTEVLVDWRLISNSRSFNKKRSAMNRWRIYREHLKLPVMKSTFLLICYFVRGMKKYYGNYGNKK